MTSSATADAATVSVGELGAAGTAPVGATPARSQDAGQHSATCYHCGQPLPAGARFQAIVGGIARAMCCAGCSAVARAIVDNGLEDYYSRRDRFPDSPREAMPVAVSDLLVFDREEIQRGFVSQPAPHEREAALILEGINCPACIWLNEAHVARQAGVIAVRINYTTRRAAVRWDARQTRLSAILAAIQAIGYHAYPYDPGAMETSRNRERRDALLRLAVAGLGMMQVMMYALPAYIAGEAGLPVDAAALMRWASLMLTFPVVAYSSLPFFRGALRDVTHGRAGMDVPVAIGIGTAFAASMVATISGHGEVYFDSVAMFVFFLLGGRYLEMRARHRAAEYLEFRARALPAVAHRFPDFSRSQDTEAIPAGALRPGDCVLVRPGENFPADGCIEEGETQVDEALLTGESLPLARKAGERVIGGAVNCGHAVVMRVERVGADTLLSGVVRLMDRALHERPHIQQLADRIAGRFVVVVLATAAASAAFWAWADPGRALPIAVAVLVVSCPCALSLATPMAMAVVTAAMARLGIVITRGQAVENLARATHFVFDKTGTLTEGRLRVTGIHLLGGETREHVLALAAALERHSEHPLGKAIVSCAARDLPATSDVKNFPGTGIEGVIEGRRVRIGQKHFIAQLCDPHGGLELSSDHATAIWLGDERGALAQILLEDQVRDDARGLVADLRRSGRLVMLMSGDGTQAVRAAAANAGILHCRARMLPQQKLAAVRQLQDEGAVVAMIGDGANDAPVLAQAQVSIAIGTGAALAQGAADMVLVSPRLSDLARGFNLARKATRIVRQNLAWAFAYNAVALPLAVGGWLTPWMAGAGMSASSLFVVLNALRARSED